MLMPQITFSIISFAMIKLYCCSCRYLRTCINENPGCLFITTNRDPTRLMTSAQEWSGIIVEKFIEFLEFLFVEQYNLQLLTSLGARNMVAAVSCSLQSKVLNSKKKGQWMHSLLIFNATIS